MEQESIQMGPLTKRQKVDRSPNIQTISLVWLDDQFSNDNTQQLRILDPNLKLFHNAEQCQTYIEDHSLTVLIVNGKLGQEIVPRVQDLTQIVAIYVFCFNKDFHQSWTKEISKIRDVFTHVTDLKDQIRINHFSINSTTIDEPVDYNPPIVEEDGLDNQFIISDLCFDYLSQMESTAYEKTEFILFYQKMFKGHSQQLAILQEFQESDSSDRALSWLFGNSHFHQTLENLFRLTDTSAMYYCRLFLRDIREQFEKYKYTSTITVYRGQLMSDEDLEELKSSVGKLIVEKSFLSTTLNRDIAMLSISEQHGVLFEIKANPEITDSKPFIKAAPFINQANDEEVLFMLGSSFKINEVFHENGLVIVKMILCANKDVKSIKDQINIDTREKHLFGYAQLQCDLSRMLDYPKILVGVKQLLQESLSKLPNGHPNCSRCYDVLEMVTFTEGNWNECLHWCEKILEIKKQVLSSNDPQLALSYENIAHVYLNKREHTQALDAFEQVLTIYKQIYGEDHLNLIQYYMRLIEIHEYKEQFTQVLQCYNQIYSIMVKHYSIDHMNLASIYNNMGKTFASLGQYSMALGYYQTSLGIKLNHFPLSSEPIALAYRSLAFIYKDMGNNEQAKEHFEKAASIYRELYSPTCEAVLEIEQLIGDLSA